MGLNELFELMDQYDVHVSIKPLYGCHGMIIAKSVGYEIVLAEGICEYKRQRTLAHELLHIKLGHLDAHCDKTRAEKEKEVHEYLEKFENGFKNF